MVETFADDGIGEAEIARQRRRRPPKIVRGPMLHAKEFADAHTHHAVLLVLIAPHRFRERLLFQRFAIDAARKDVLLFIALDGRGDDLLSQIRERVNDDAALLDPLERD